MRPHGADYGHGHETTPDRRPHGNAVNAYDLAGWTKGARGCRTMRRCS